VNLIEPLKQIEELAKKKGIKMQKIEVGLRTGDTTANEKAKMARKSPHILVTTPESLAIMINSPKFVEKFFRLEFMIVDEIHSLAENKRGTHLSLTLERIQALSVMPIVRIGLSATVSPLERIANYLVGQDRECLIAEVEMVKKLDLQILSPVDDFLKTNSIELNTKLYEMIDNLIQKNKTTLIFTNTRAATERVVNNLKEKFPKNYFENIGAHHSSLSKEHRLNIEQNLRDGKLKVVVCSTSLELGIDIGYIDLVILLGSPKAVSRAMQRIGRAGHQLHETARGKFIVYDFDDLVECAIIQKNSKERIIDEIHIPENCLDVLAQQIFGMAIYKTWHIDEMLALIRQSFCYRNLTKDDFFSVISYLSGEYDLNVRNLYSKIWYDPTTGQVGKRGKMARVIYMTNIGTIPDESFASVVNRNGGEIGKIDEVFLEKLKKGDVFVLGGKRYQFLYNKGMKVYVIPSDRQPTIPSWFSEMLPLSFTTACSIGKFRRLLDEKFRAKKSPSEIKGFVAEYVYCDDKTAQPIYNYFEKQFKTSLIPSDKKIVVEEFNSDGKRYVIFHSLFGRRVNDALSRACAFSVASARRRDVEIGISDNGFFIAGKEIETDKILKGLKLLNEKNIRKVLDEAIDKTEVLKRRFRHCAARSLMILRNYRGYTKSAGKQQMSSHFLLAAVNKSTKDFPILKEARREVLEDLMDINNAAEILRKINNHEIKIETKNTKIMSPFAVNMILQSHSDVIKIEDKNAFIKRVWEELEK
jgi:ATP-dependent Lhr-like helicase